MRRVILVDDDDIARHGMATLLHGTDGIEVVGSFSHSEALQVGASWAEADVVVVDAADEQSSFDQFPGVAVVEALRSHRGRSETTVIVVTGHFFDPALRRRMREAAADFFYHRSDLRSAGALRGAVLRPARQYEVSASDDLDDLDDLVRHGVSRATRVNEAVRFAGQHGLSGLPAPRGERSRAWLRRRQEFNRVARLSPMNRTGLPPDRDQHEPSLVQIDRFLRWATRVKSEGQWGKPPRG